MKSTLATLFAALLLIIFIASCSNPNVIKDLSDSSYQLLDTDSSAVNFPGDYKGDIAVISFIYTHCPDVCPVITANMKNIQRELEDTTNIRFIEISFDPERDTPSVMAEYKNLYELDEQFSMLTGTPTVVDSLLNHLDIVAKKTYVDSARQDSNQYMMKHSNTIYLMDEDSRIRAEYPANLVPPENVIEDIQALR
jgi:protein SCO1/2